MAAAAAAKNCTRGTSWGQPIVEANAVVLRSAFTEDAARPNILKIPTELITQASGTKNDVAMALAAPAGSEEFFTSEVRLAIPQKCHGLDEVDPARALLRGIQSKMQVAPEAAVALSGGTAIGTFSDVTLSQPSGRFDIQLTSTWFQFTDTKKGTVVKFPVKNVSRFFLVPAGGDEGANYLAVSLQEPIKVGSSVYTHIVMLIATDLVIEEGKPWVCDVQAAEELAKLFPNGTIKPTMHGPLTDVITSVFKTVTQAKVIGLPVNKETRKLVGPSFLSCQFKGNTGWLYFLKEYLLFLHRPATLIPFSSIVKVSTEHGVTHVILTFHVKKPGAVVAAKAKDVDRMVFGSIEKKKLPELLKYLGEKGVQGDEAEDDEDDEDEEDEEDEDYSDGGEESDEDEDEDEEEGGKKKHKEKKHKEKKHKEKKDKHKEHKHKHKHKEHKHKHKDKDRKRPREDDE